jgi:hypothetical protein
MIAPHAALCALALACASAAQAQEVPYGPPPPPRLPDGYQRDAGDGTLIVWRPATRGRVLLVVADDEPSPKNLQQADLLQIARAKNMRIAFLGAAPTAGFAPRLRAAVAALRGSLKLIGAGAGRNAAALQDLSRGAPKLFDSLLLVDARPWGPGEGWPFVVELYGSDAFWRDAPAPEPAPKSASWRRFFIAGSVASPPADPCPDALNDRSIEPALRALLIALDAFLLGGPAPPASREAELAPKKSLVWPKLPGGAAPPQSEGLAPRIDADGNETSGLRLPDQALPLATFTGWSAASKDCRGGTKFDFPASRAAREAEGDPRLSLLERYGSRSYYVAALRSVADRLVKERLLLPQDADAYVAAGKKAPF